MLLLLTIPENAVLRVDGTLKAFTHDGLIPTLMLFFLIPGLVYGLVTKSIKNDKDLSKMMGSISCNSWIIHGSIICCSSVCLLTLDILT